ncbi:hypothetical protein EUGRSUZ_H03089 [Eucalyptus grandis]|uniref:Uncharacterized protein n=2 Tax=Eucalyptus grandis TaxID=71139 RepID=A0ACC3JUE0_EUCGR|nr:hypothetical protein EUGRSUZ_H03089 [Eucalyptus grandis]
MNLGFLDLGVAERFKLVAEKKTPNTFNYYNLIFHSNVRKITTSTKRTPQVEVFKTNYFKNKYCIQIVGIFIGGKVQSCFLRVTFYLLILFQT